MAHALVAEVSRSGASFCAPGTPVASPRDSRPGAVDDADAGRTTTVGRRRAVPGGSTSLGWSTQSVACTVPRASSQTAEHVGCRLDVLCRHTEVLVQLAR